MCNSIVALPDTQALLGISLHWLCWVVYHLGLTRLYNILQVHGCHAEYWSSPLLLHMEGPPMFEHSFQTPDLLRVVSIADLTIFCVAATQTKSNEKVKKPS
jgi:hypothetical protein